jgi:hypothetical protein
LHLLITTRKQHIPVLGTFLYCVCYLVFSFTALAEICTIMRKGGRGGGGGQVISDQLFIRQKHCAYNKHY